jgi:hypothetical protein
MITHDVVRSSMVDILRVPVKLGWGPVCKTCGLEICKIANVKSLLQ